MHRLGARDLQANLFRQALANFLRQAIVHAPRAFLGGIEHRDWSRRRDGHDYPDDRRQGEPGERGNLQPEGVPGAKVANDSKSQQKNSGRNGGQRDQPYIDDAVHLLAAAAVLAAGKMVFVVAAHFWRQAGDVIPPARQNFSHDWIDAQLTHAGNKTYSRIGSSASFWVASNTRF